MRKPIQDLAGAYWPPISRSWTTTYAPPCASGSTSTWWSGNASRISWMAASTSAVIAVRSLRVVVVGNRLELLAIVERDRILVADLILVGRPLLLEEKEVGLYVRH